MEQFHKLMIEFKKQLEKGNIQKAYQGLMDYILKLKLYLKNKYPEYIVSGSIYFGYMDMTYFAFFPESLKRRKLKVGIIFNYDEFRFEVWLFGYNKNIQTEYWKMFKENENDWGKYHIPKTTKGVDFIMYQILVANPDFSDLDKLTNQIESRTLKFIEDVENLLSKH